MSTSRYSRGTLRYLSVTEQSRWFTKTCLILLPILINISWVTLYFVERNQDTYRLGGPCSNSSLNRYATPFFSTVRSVSFWQVQVAFTLLTCAVWAPYRYLRPKEESSWVFAVVQIVVDGVTLFPFLLGMVYPPALFAYVPSYLRVWIIREELVAYLPNKKTLWIKVSELVMHVGALTVTMVGSFEWAENNFPLDVVAYTLSDYKEIRYPCITTLEALYWFLVTFATVGYGDVVPTNDVARVFVIFFVVLFLLLLPLFVGKVLDFIHEANDLTKISFHKRREAFFVQFAKAMTKSLTVDSPLSCATTSTTTTTTTTHRARSASYLLRESAIHCLHSFRSCLTRCLRSTVNTVVNEKVDDHVVVDGRVMANLGQKAMSLLAPKFFRWERPAIRYVVMMLDDDPSADLRTVKANAAEGYTRMFLIRGDIASEEDVSRSNTANAKEVYILPGHVERYQQSHNALDFGHAQPSHTDLTREYCITRDFDTMRRVWAAQAQISDAHRIHTFLYHYANRHLIEIVDQVCSCPCSLVLAGDRFEQRVAASSCMIPGFGTLLINGLLLGGGCTFRTFQEHEVEINREDDFDEISKAQIEEALFKTNSLAIPIGGLSAAAAAKDTNTAAKDNTSPASVELPRRRHESDHPIFEKRTSMPRRFDSDGDVDDKNVVFGDPDEDDFEVFSNDDTQYVRSLRYGLFRIEYLGENPVWLGDICNRSLIYQGVFVLGFYPRAHVCARGDVFHPDCVQFHHRAIVRPRDFIVCLGRPHNVEHLWYEKIDAWIGLITRHSSDFHVKSTPSGIASATSSLPKSAADDVAAENLSESRPDSRVSTSEYDSNRMARMESVNADGDFAPTVMTKLSSMNDAKGEEEPSPSSLPRELLAAISTNSMDLPTDHHPNGSSNATAYAENDQTTRTASVRARWKHVVNKITESKRAERCEEDARRQLAKSARKRWRRSIQEGEYISASSSSLMGDSTKVSGSCIETTRPEPKFFVSTVKRHLSDARYKVGSSKILKSGNSSMGHAGDVHISQHQDEGEDDSDDDNDYESDHNQYPQHQHQRDSPHRGGIHFAMPTRRQLRNHIILSSNSHDSYVHFVKQLRRVDVVWSPKVPILLFDPFPPNKFKWSELCYFEEVYYMQGRPYIAQDLLRAGFDHAACLVLLTDLRASYEHSQDASALLVDRENMLADRVANRLKAHLNCSTRILIHTSREESCNFENSANSRTMNLTSDRDATICKLYRQVWSPVATSSYIAGEAWSPACFSLMLFASGQKGKWVDGFVDAFLETAGTKFGLRFREVPFLATESEDSRDDGAITFEQAALALLQTGHGLAIGLYRNFWQESAGKDRHLPTLRPQNASRNSTFRGVIVCPHANVVLYPNKDCLYTIGGYL